MKSGSAFLNPALLMTFWLPKGMIRNDLYSYLISLLHHITDHFWAEDQAIKIGLYLIAICCYA